jgi:hypothetical protein
MGQMIVQTADLDEAAWIHLVEMRVPRSRTVPRKPLAVWP